MRTLPNDDGQGIYACLRNREIVKVTRPNLSPIILYPEFITGSKILWSVRIKTGRGPIKRIAGTLEEIEKWVI